jgi:hypothetical protein
MLQKASFLGIFLIPFLYAAEPVTAQNEYGSYMLLKPQTTYRYEELKTACKSIGEGWEIPGIEALFNTPKQLKSVSEKSLYMSSTPSPTDTDEIYYFSFEDSDVNTAKKSSNLYGVCFKPKKSEKLAKRFRKMGDWVKDDFQKIAWLEAEPNRMDYADAKTFCEAKSARLPHIDELFSIAIFKAFNEKEFTSLFGKTQPKYHWSLDANDDFSNTALVAGFLKASVASSQKRNRSFVRCVKDAK